jgi:hypothetical protein
MAIKRSLSQLFAPAEQPPAAKIAVKTTADKAAAAR